MGSNMAENHPVGFQWVMEARERGAEVIHVDPRFTRTSAAATKHVPIRAGTDIAFLGGIIHYILENDRAFKEYVANYTNGPVILREDFKDSEELDGFFSGWHADKNGYTFETWQYEGMDMHGAAGQREGESTLAKVPVFKQKEDALKNGECHVFLAAGKVVIRAGTARARLPRRSAKPTLRHIPDLGMLQINVKRRRHK